MKVKWWLKAAAQLCAVFLCNECGQGYETYAEAMQCALEHHRDKYGR